MSTPDNAVHQSQDIIQFYSDHLKDHGDSAKGVGWKNDNAQEIRFEQLLRVVREKTRFSINDLGCGTGKLFPYLRAQDFSPSAYLGYDILPEMIRAAKDKLKDESTVILKKIDTASEMEGADYSVCSGIFNVKYEASEKKWLNHVLDTIAVMNGKSVRGFSFNLLTQYSDKEFMQSYLYYADPLFMFDFCKKNFSKNVALLHDYDQYDFTIIVRK